ncbi:UDP-N-acetylglucosamine 2-epimerase (non-hydrolyzing) [Candidatus Bathyarchaeota archaeon]|nr:UDP-N-acetylglucosamine 2-epimerase (non-hydrolyzing) [Candidatus Bathyarchaeota archaeon]
MKISIVLGTRPEIIKLSPVIRECERLGLDYFVLHTGQHYSYNMDRVFFEQLELPEAEYNLDVGSGTHGEQTGRMLMGIERVLREEEPDCVLVEGDTNTVLAGALAATKLGVKVGHVEAGLRSYDREMPEEINRVLADHCSDLLFAPTEKSRQILLGEGISGDKVFVTGNTVVDAVFQNLEISKRKGGILSHLGIDDEGYFLVTVHRQENVDDEKRFRGILKGLELVQEEFGFKVVYPIHPRAKKQLKAFDVEANGVMLVEPLDYLGFLQLESNAKLVLTDSGGVQEEACVLGVPCVTLRYNTERPETLEVGANVLAGTDPYEIVAKTKLMLSGNNSWENPFGDGKAAERIVNLLRTNVFVDKSYMVESKKYGVHSVLDSQL